MVRELGGVGCGRGRMKKGRSGGVRVTCGACKGGGMGVGVGKELRKGVG